MTGPRSARRPLVVIDGDPVLKAIVACWRFIVVGALLGCLVGLGWHWLTPPTYTASVEVEAPETASQIDLNPAGRALDNVAQDTEAQIIRSDAVVQAAAAASTTTMTTARDSLSISVHPLSRVLTISFTARSGDDALEGAQAAADAFLEQRQILLVGPLRAYLEKKLAETDPVVSGAGGVSSGREEVWQRSLRSLLRQPTAGVVLNQAALTAGPDRGDAEIPAISGMLLGAVGGLAAGAFIRHRWPAYPRIGRKPVSARWSALRANPRKLAAICCLAAGVATIGAGTTMYIRYPQTYTTTVRVLVEPLPGTGFSTIGSRGEIESALATEALLATSDQVLAQATLGSGVTAEELNQRTTTGSSASARVIMIRVRAQSPELATQRARRLAESYIHTRRLRAMTTSNQRRTILEAQLTAIEADLRASAGVGIPADVRSVYNSRIRFVRASYGWAIVTDPSGGQILREAVRTDDTPRYVAMAVYALWGSGAALLAASAWLNRRRRTPAGTPDRRPHIPRQPSMSH